MTDTQTKPPENRFCFLETNDGSQFVKYGLAAGGQGVPMFKTPAEALEFAGENGITEGHRVKECDAGEAYAFLHNAKSQGATHIISNAADPSKLSRAPIASILLALDLARK